MRPHLAARPDLPAILLVASAALASLTVATLAWTDRPAHPPAARPARAAADAPAQTAPDPGPRAVLLPVLGPARPEAGTCRAWITAQNVGVEPTQAVLLVWGPPSGDPTACVGPFAEVECGGLIAPGAAWQWFDATSATDARSGVVFSVTARRLSEVGAAPGAGRGGDGDDIVAEALCAALGSDLAGGCEAYARFKAAWDGGEAWDGVPLDRAAGSPIAVHVLRRECPGDLTPGAGVSASYVGLPGGGARTGGAGDGPSRYLAAPILAGRGRVSLVHLQNAGAARATATLWFQAHGACDGGRMCRSVAVDPGASVTVDATSCVPSPFEGNLRVESTGPLGVLVDIVGGDDLATFAAVPAAAGPAGVGTGDPGRLAPAARLFGPLIYHREHGSQATIAVQNHDADRAARVEVTFLDRRGASVESRPGEICPGGSATFDLPLADDRPGEDLGTVRVASLPPAGDPAGTPALVSAVALVERFVDASLSYRIESAAYNLLPEPAADAAGGGPADPGGPTTSAAGALIALPLVARDLDGLGSLTELALANRAAEPGWADAAVVVFDANGPVEALCRRVGAGEVASIDLYVTSPVGVGFVGSAVVSATAWSRPAAGGVGEAAAPGPARLSAALVTRTGTSQGEDVPGDELAVSLGVPIRRVPPGLAEAAAVCDSARRPGPPAGLTPAPATPTPVATPAGPRAAALAGQAHLPVLSQEGVSPVCAPTVRARNAGGAPAKVVLVAWTSPGLCPPQCAGPEGVACSGLLAPGGTWTFGPETVAGEGMSGVAYSFNTRTLGEIGAQPGSATPVADALCLRLREDLAGSCGVWRRFKLAYTAGSAFEGIPLDRAYGGALDVTVDRDCPGDIDPRERARASYAGLTGGAFDLAAADGGSPAALGGPYRYFQVPVYSDMAGFNTVFYLQNAGLTCASATLSFHGSGDCLWSRKCHVLAIAPGESAVFDASDCVGPDWLGSAVISAGQPLAIAVDILGRDTLRTRVAGNGDRPYDLSGDGAVDAGDVAVLEAALGTRPGDPRWNPRADLHADDVIDDLDRGILEDNLCRWRVPPAAATPPAAPPARPQAFLPALDLGLGICHTAVAVQNAGAEPVKALVVTWREPARDAAECRGPMQVECSALLAPGGSWHLVNARSLFGPRSGAVFSLSGMTFEALGVPGRSGVAADALCQRLRGDLTGDCEGYRRFKLAYDGGAVYDGVPLDRATGGPLAVHTQRDCPSDLVPGGRSAADYEGVGAGNLGESDAAAGGYAYFAPLMYLDKAGFNTRLYIQNAGVAPATVEPWFQPQNSCSLGWPCEHLTVQPGEAVVLDGSDCAGPDWQGSAWLRSTQPLAVVVEINGRGSALNYTAVARPAAGGASGAAAGTAGTVAYGPVTYHPEHGWDLGVQVQNLSLTGGAMVEVQILDEAGVPLWAYEAPACPGGTETFFFPIRDVLPGRDASSEAGPIGSVRVISRPPAGDPHAPPAPIAALATMFRYTDPARTEMLEIAAYNLVPDALGFAWPNGRGAGGLASGAGALAVPGAVHAPADGATSELVVANLVPVPGRTDVDVVFTDASGPVDSARLSLAAGETRVLPLASRPLPVGFRGGAVVSAVYWDHAVRDAESPAGSPRRDLVGLSAALVWHPDGKPLASGAVDRRRGVALGIPVRGVGLAPGSGRREWVYLPAVRNGG